MCERGNDAENMGVSTLMHYRAYTWRTRKFTFLMPLPTTGHAGIRPLKC